MIRDQLQRVADFIFRYIYAVFSCVYLFVLGFFWARHRAFISQICSHFGLKEGLFDKRLIPQIPFSEVAPEDVAIHIHEMVAGDGNVAPLELIAINALVVSRRPQALFEIGTFDGRTTLNMASNASQEAVVHTLDLPRAGLAFTRLPIAPGDKAFIAKEISGGRYRGKDAEKKIVTLSGDSAAFDFSEYLNAMDFVFIDGSHSYEYVLSDSHLALRLLREGRGVVLWHDYGAWKGVTRALNALYAKDPSFKGLKHIAGTSLVYCDQGHGVTRVET